MIAEWAETLARDSHVSFEQGDWDELFSPYSWPLVQQAMRRVAGAKMPLTAANVGDEVVRLASGAVHHEQPERHEPKASPEQEARWVRACAFVLAAPADHPVRVHNRESFALGRSADERVGEIERLSREHPLAGVQAAAYRRHTKQGKIGVLRALGAS